MTWFIDLELNELTPDSGFPGAYMALKPCVGSPMILSAQGCGGSDHYGSWNWPVDWTILAGPRLLGVCGSFGESLNKFKGEKSLDSSRFNVIDSLVM